MDYYYTNQGNSNNKKIIILDIVGFLFIGLSIYLFMSSSSDKPKPPTNPPTKPTT